MAERYNPKIGCVYSIVLDGYFTKEDANEKLKLLSGCGFRAHKAEV